MHNVMQGTFDIFSQTKSIIDASSHVEFIFGTKSHRNQLNMYKNHQ